MRPDQTPSGSRRSDPVARLLGGSALAVAIIGCVFAMTASSPAAPDRDAGPTAVAAARRTAKRRASKRRAPALPGASTRPRPLGILRLDRSKRFPASVIPKIASARAADRLGGATRDALTLGCAATTVDLGTWCLDASTQPIPPEDAGKDDFFYATKTCIDAGGYLPSAAQLIGAADRVKLASTIDDDVVTASVDEDRSDGYKDQREMSSTLFTTIAGASAAGSEGVSAGSKGNPLAGEPDPQVRPADPRPATVQYMTVYDNRNRGGFAGGKPINTPERFRCAYDKAQGAARAEE
ncbi:hypothetical protein Q5424_17240 [Conexibacter sp. JD483]|uniref:hypothetical protein n=1 Tax=unclassified Conexibacter TaxID=2627773 RepID=UPI0027185E7D|nr:MULTISPECIES: hypothetical protein [unclassified Conexibacter]MDO8188672.1 hypothetical protein [Conexibacter sp. CPCC 205706]MDO8199355.1 hypothetical protein [Conexibacter sp. CPCC 205762]MDR9370845.1 hypothetical protein [Conexibacter sp. JD483]